MPALSLDDHLRGYQVLPCEVNPVSEMCANLPRYLNGATGQVVCGCIVYQLAKKMHL
jgi:hypothetical protein